MNLTQSAKAYNNNLKAKHEKLSEKVNEITNCYSVFSKKKFDEVIIEIRAILADLSEMVMPEDRPDWMIHLDDWTVTAQNMQTPQEHRQTLATFLARKNQILNFRWDVTANPTSPAIDIKSLIAEAEKNNKVPELFRDAIKMAAELSVHDSIDSSLARQTLQEIVSALRSAQKAPFQEKRMLLKFIGLYIKNVGIEYLQDVPVAGKLFSAFEKTSEQLASAVAKAELEVAQKTETAAIESATKVRNAIEDLRPKQITYSPEKSAEGVEQ